MESCKDGQPELYLICSGRYCIVNIKRYTLTVRVARPGREFFAFPNESKTMNDAEKEGVANSALTIFLGI